MYWHGSQVSHSRECFLDNSEIQCSAHLPVPIKASLLCIKLMWSCGLIICRWCVFKHWKDGKLYQNMICECWMLDEQPSSMSSYMLYVLLLFRAWGAKVAEPRKFVVQTPHLNVVISVISRSTLPRSDRTVTAAMRVRKFCSVYDVVFEVLMPLLPRENAAIIPGRY